MHFVISKHTTIQRSSRGYDTGIKTDIQINETEQSLEKKKNLRVYGQTILNKSVHNRKKKIVPSTTVLEKLDIHVTTCKRTKLDLYLILYTELTKKQLKSNSNESIYKTDSQTQKTILLVTKQKRRKGGTN